jgi:hypothetical protein
VEIRNFKPGDEEAQAAIYNEAASSLPRFKPAAVPEVRRRCQAADFDPESRLFALESGQPVAYIAFHANGRIGYPWCRPGSETAADPLFAAALARMKGRGRASAFAAYRHDWRPVQQFFLERGFHLAREMVNFLLDQVDMPTLPGRRQYPLSPLHQDDISAVCAMGADVMRTTSPREVEHHLFDNPYFTPDAVSVVRGRSDSAVLAVGIVVASQDYADPRQVDANMPCFRLGAFGTEGMQVKRINGLFSFLVREAQNTSILGLDLMGHAVSRLSDSPGALAAQVPSDATHLLQFYKRYFQRQGSFPVFERPL